MSWLTGFFMGFLLAAGLIAGTDMRWAAIAIVGVAVVATGINALADMMETPKGANESQELP